MRKIRARAERRGNRGVDMSANVSGELNHTGTIHVHIERVVFDGFNAPRVELERVATEFARELEQRLASAEFAPQQSLALGRTVTSPIRLSGDNSRALAPQRLAAAVASHLSAVSGGETSFPDRSSSITLPEPINSHTKKSTKV